MNRTFIGGAVLLILGFLLFQFGFTLLLGVEVELGNNPVQITQAGGLLLETIGGIILLVGLLACFMSIAHDRRKGSYNTQQYLSKLNSSISGLEKKVESHTVQIVQLASSLRERKPATPPTPPPKTGLPKKDDVVCKFCHVKIPVGVTFCPSCGRSQV